MVWQTALREIKEETGITDVSLYTTIKFEQMYSFVVENYIYAAPVFVGYVVNNQDVKLNYEHSEYGWFTIEEAKEGVILHHNIDQEMLKIFDNDKNHIGIATREEVHRLGHWHEAFHCWFISKEEGDKYYIYLQLRSSKKKDYPNLLDITAAGHLLAHETILDGVREIKEEIGIEVLPNQLELLGSIDYCVEKENLIDREIAHTYLYIYDQTLSDFVLQEEEVAGIFKTDFNEFYKLWTGSINEITMIGTNQKGEPLIEVLVGKDQFVPHYESFYQTIVKLIREKITI